MIGLNKIGLNQVQLNRLRLNAPFPTCREMAGGGGSSDGFPQLPGDVTRWHFGGLTNEMMAAMDDPRIEDADHKGRFLSFKNFAWGGMSGVGGYVDNWNSSADWDINSYWVNSHTDHKLQFIKVGTVIQMKSNNIYNAENVYKNILNVNGLTEAVNKGSVKALRINAVDPITSKTIKTFSFDTDGVIQISFDDVLQDYYVAYFLSGNNTNDIDITIEQLPLYPGALVFDGVDDYGTCDNFPILTKEKGYTVVALRQWLSFQDIGYPTLVVNSTDRLAAFSFEDFRNETKSTWNWGRSVGLSDYKIPLLYTYQTSTSYNSKTIYAGATEEGSNILQVCRSGFYCANAAIWEIVILDHDATEEELTKIKDYFVKTYPWLFPDQAWTVVGKTNEDEDRATIANITGNGNNLILSNFGFAEGSGYNEEGEYAGYLVTDGVDDIIQSKRFLLHRNWTMVGDWRFMPPGKNTNSGIVKSPAIRLYNQLNNIAIYINRTTNPKSISGRSIKAVCSDGRIYLDDWSEFLDTELQTDLDNNAVITIANYGVGFTKIIFKNLSFYDNHLLSKDDCIKAYNYLQTLKAK